MEKQKIKRKLQIGILGWAGIEEYPKGKGPTKKELTIAKEVGFLLARAGTIVITGGKGGVMEYATQGAKRANGTTIGVITGPRRTSNVYTDIEIVTGSKNAGFDEVFIPLMCDAVIVIGGGAGTLQEICVSYRNKIPIIIIEKTFGWAQKILKEKYLDPRKITKIIKARNASDAVEKAISHCNLSIL